MSMSAERVVEVKRYLDGSEQRFDCELVYSTRWLAVALYHVDRQGPEALLAELDSYGLFWRRRPYNCYYMVRPGSTEAAITRFDVVRDVEFEAGDEVKEVRYVDLLLDLRVQGGIACWEDEDEVAKAVAAALLSPSDLIRIARARAVLGRRHGRVASEARRLLCSLGRLPS